MPIGSELPDVGELLAQRGRAILIERLLEHDGRSTTARVVVASGRWLQRPDRPTPAWLGLEYMAQCVAAHEAMLARAAGRAAPAGMLVAARALRFYCSQFGPDAVLRVRAGRVSALPHFGALFHACTIHAERGEAVGELLAEGKLGVARQPSHAAASGSA